MRRPCVDVLYSEGCPNHEPACALVERIAAELQVQPAIRLGEVRDAEAALELRFLGSPTIRVEGCDVEPGADQRRDFVFACRVYRGEHGSRGQPNETWVRAALAGAAE
jgi:hypothetical protein